MPSSEGRTWYPIPISDNCAMEIVQDWLEEEGTQGSTLSEPIVRIWDTCLEEDPSNRKLLASYNDRDCNATGV